MEVAQSQPATFNPDKLSGSDNLFSGTSLRVIRASNVRDRERLLHLSHSVEGAKRSTHGEYEFRKKGMRRRSQQLQARMGEIATRRRVEEEGVRQAREARDYAARAAGGEGSIVGNRPSWGRLKTNVVSKVAFAQRMTNLGLLPPSSPRSSQSDTFEVTGEDGHVFIITGNNNRPGQTVNNAVNNTVNNAVNNTVNNVARRGTVFGPSQGRMGPGQVGTQGGTQVGTQGGTLGGTQVGTQGGTQVGTQGGTRQSTVIDTEELKRLVLRLHREDTSVTDPGMMSDEERKIYEFIQRVLSLSRRNEASARAQGTSGPATLGRPRANTRIYTEDPLRRLSMALGIELNTITEPPAPLSAAERRRRYLLGMNINPILLPPIHTVRARKLRNREAEWDITERTGPPKPLTDRQWDEMKFCRYLRPPAKKFQTRREAGE